MGQPQAIFLTAYNSEDTMSKPDNKKSPSSGRVHTIVLLTRKKGCQFRSLIGTGCRCTDQLPSRYRTLFVIYSTISSGVTHRMTTQVETSASTVLQSSSTIARRVWNAGWASEAGQRAMADVPNFLERLAELILEDHVIVDRDTNNEELLTRSPIILRLDNGLARRANWKRTTMPIETDFAELSRLNDQVKGKTL